MQKELHIYWFCLFCLLLAALVIIKPLSDFHVPPEQFLLSDQHGDPVVAYVPIFLPQEPPLTASGIQSYDGFDRIRAYDDGLRLSLIQPKDSHD